MSLTIASLFWAYIAVTGVARWELLRTAIASTSVLSWEINTLAYLLCLPPLLLLVCVSHRVGYDISRWPRIVLVNVLLAVVFGLFARPIMALAWAMLSDYPFSTTLARILGPDLSHTLLLCGSTILDDGVNFLVLQGILAGAAFYARMRYEQEQRQRLAGLYDRARLQALRMQTNPHFLFNTLSAIAGLIRARPDAAESMVTRLGDLFRSTLTDRDADFVPLHRELHLGEQYLAIQAERFDTRLRYELEADGNSQSAAIPPLLLQPLLENAVQHGLTTQEGPLCIEVRCAEAAGGMTILVRNRFSQDSVAPEHHGCGFGLENVRARLHAAFGPSAELAVGQTSTGHFEARMMFPARQISSAAHKPAS